MKLLDLLNETSTIDEYNVIGSAVRLDEIPPEYRKMKFLGRGATTLAFEKDPETVVIFTRDDIKIDWLIHGLHMVKNHQVITPVRPHHITGMQDVDLQMIEMPKLYPLSADNRRKIMKELQYWGSVKSKLAAGGRGDRRQLQQKIADLAGHYDDEHPDSIFTPFLNWLINYDPEQYELDLGPRQFKQTHDGKVVLLDPVVSRELMKLFHSNNRQKHQQRY